MDSQYVIYTSTPLSHIPVATNDDLQTILGAIDTAINTSSSAPDYTGYNLYCVKEVDGTTHPTNTQNFAEGISKMLCDFKTAYTTFSGTTYVTDQSVITSAINALQVPALTYVPFSITNTDTNTQVWNKTFTGLTAITASIVPTSANWSSWSVSAPTTIVGAFNTVIAKDTAQDTAIAGKQATIANLNNAANCLTAGGGTSSDPIRTTVTLLTTYAGTLPTFDYTAITGTCVTVGTTLQATVQNIINEVEGLATGSVRTAGTGLTLSGSGCGGKTLGLDTTYAPLYKVAITSGDAATAGYLGAKITSLDNSITIDTSTHTDKLDLSVAIPMDNKVKVTSSDSSADYLRNKIPSTLDTIWGINLTVSTDVNGELLYLTPSIGQPNLFAQTLLDLISADSDLLLQFANLVAQTSSVPGLAIINLTVDPGSGVFTYHWSHQTGLSQIAKWRIKNVLLWSTSGVSPSNPLSSTAITTVLTSANVNTVLQFQVDTVYSTGNVGSNLYEMINFDCQSLSHSIASGAITVNQSGLAVDVVEYQLYNSTPTLVQSLSASGTMPTVTFASVASGNYTVKWRYGVMVNGSTLYSDDASQLNAYCASGTITVP